MQSLRVDNEKLNGSLQQVQDQFARLKVQHLKKDVTSTTLTQPIQSNQVFHGTSLLLTSMPNYILKPKPIVCMYYLFLFCLQVSVKQDTPQGKSSDSGDPTALPRPDPSNQQQSVAQQPPTIPNVNTVPPATLDNYKQQPEARCVPNSPTEGHPSMNSDNPIVEVNGFRNATAQNERQSSTGPQSDNGIRYPPSLKVKQSHSSAPSSTNFALSEQAASPTDSNKMALVLGEKQLEIPSKMPSDFNQSDYPANTHQGGGYQDPVNNFQDNLPQGHYQDQYQNQPHPWNVPPSNHPSQWPNQQPYLQDHLYQQQPGAQYEQPRSPHYNPQQQNYGQSNYNQQHGNVQQQGPHWCNHGRQDQWENQHYQGAGQQAYNYPNDGLQHNTQNPSYPMPSNLRDDGICYPLSLKVKQSHSSAPSNTNFALSEQAKSSDSGDATALPRPDLSNQQRSVAQQPPTIPNVNTVPPTTQDTYNQQPAARLVPNEGRPSCMNFDNPRPVMMVEMDSFPDGSIQTNMEKSAQFCEALEGGLADYQSLFKRYH